MGNFGGDANADIATANDDGTVSLLVRTGSATFSDAVVTPGGYGPADIEAADFNGDSRLDIVLAHSGSSDSGQGSDDLVILLARADGTFSPSVRHTGVNAQSVAVGDLNGDKKPDIATASQGDHASVFLGHGDGTFSDPTNFPIGAAFASGISLADFDRDGNLDLATANSLIGRGRSYRSVSVLLGHGDGTFAAPRVFPVGGAQPIMPVVADFNGDGAPDIATPNGDPSTTVSILLGVGNGDLSPAIEYGTGPDPHSLVVADLNSDGHPDIAAWDSGVRGGLPGRGLSVLFGKGDGTFAPTIDKVMTADGEVQAAADVTGDGKIDLIVAGTDSLIFFINSIGS